MTPQGDSDLLGILPKNRTEPENVVSRLLHFHRLPPLTMAGRARTGNVDKSALP
jgi:hypothetical protein